MNRRKRRWTNEQCEQVAGDFIDNVGETLASGQASWTSAEDAVESHLPSMADYRELPQPLEGDEAKVRDLMRAESEALWAEYGHTAGRGTTLCITAHCPNPPVHSVWCAACQPTGAGAARAGETGPAPYTEPITDLCAITESSTEGNGEMSNYESMKTLHRIDPDRDYIAIGPWTRDGYRMICHKLSGAYAVHCEWANGSLSSGDYFPIAGGSKLDVRNDALARWVERMGIQS